MASKTFLLLALAFAVVLLISSEVARAAANDLTSDHEGELDGYNGGGKGYYGGGYGKGGGYGRGKYGKGGGYGRGGYGKGGRKGCKYGCCGGGRYYGGCKCCSTFEEATAYKQQTQN